MHAHGIKVIEQVGEGIVPLIETGNLESEEMKALLQTYLEPMIAQNIDYLVLGCTHYPYLIPMLTEMLPKDVKIIDSGLAVAKQTKSILASNGILNTSTNKTSVKLYTNGNIEVLNSILNHQFDTSYFDF